MHLQGVPKKMFPCLRGYHSAKNNTTIKSKVSFKIYMQFSFRWALKFLHLDHWNLRNWSLKMVTLLLKSWQNPTHFQLLLYRSLSAINYFHLIQIVICWLNFFMPRLWDDFRNFIGKVQGCPSLNMAKKTRPEENCFCHISKSRVTIFKPYFLRL